MQVTDRRDVLNQNMCQSNVKREAHNLLLTYGDKFSSSAIKYFNIKLKNSAIHRSLILTFAKLFATGIPACRKLFRSNEFVLKTLKLSCSLPEVKYASSRKYLQHALKSNLAFSRYSFLFAATCRKCFSQESLLRNIIIFFVAKSKSFFLRSHKKIFAFFLCILQK